MTERITVRRVDPWVDHKQKHCGCKDASRYNRCQGLATCTLRADHPERLTPPPTVEYSARARYNPAMLLVAVAFVSLGFIIGFLVRGGI
jgi:hypothetical protein